MKKVSLIFVILTLLLSGCMMRPIRYETVPEIRQAYAASVPVVIKTGRAIGSGTIIYSEKNDKFVVLTAAHVVIATVQFNEWYVEYNKKIIAMRPMKVDIKKDLALLVSLKATEEKLPTIKIAKYRPKLGGTIWAIGSSWGDKKTVSRGVFGKVVYDKIRERILYRVDAAAFYGSSGCGLFNSKQELVGVIVTGYMTHPVVAVPGGALGVGVGNIKLFLKGVLPQK